MMSPSVILLFVMAAVSAQRLPSTISFSGSNISVSVGFVIPPPAALQPPLSDFSSDISAVGDINGDGFTDFAIATYGTQVGNVSFIGKVFVVLGTDSIFTRQKLFRAKQQQQHARPEFNTTQWIPGPCDARWGQRVRDSGHRKFVPWL